MTDNPDIPANPPGGGKKGVKFSAVLHPHRSLGPDGFVIVMVFISVIGFVAGLAFLIMGAWPVLGFFGLDVLLIYWAFKANYRAARMCETVDVTDDTVIVRRYDQKGGFSEWSFQPYWLRIEMREGAGTCGPLYLISHGRRLIIGAFLSADERREFAQALRAALAR